MRTSTFAALAFLSTTLYGCVTASSTPATNELPVTNAPTVGVPVPVERLGLNETKINMNVEGGFMRELSQEFSGELKFQMRMTEEHANKKWLPVVGVCLRAPSSEASACMQFARVPNMGPDFRAVFYYTANKQAPRQHNLVLVDHTAVLGQAVNISVKQRGESLVFSINGKEETFPVPLKAGILEYHCSSGACEFRD